MIKVVTGASLLEASKNAIKQLGTNNTYLIVPDRATLVFEELLFDVLQISSTLRYDVCGLSTLVGRYVKKDELAISEIEAVLFVKKAVESVKDRLKYFVSGNINVCKQIYKFISQFKSSSLKPADIVCKSERTSLKNKFDDLKIIFEEFEKLTFDRMDPSTQLDTFAKIIATEKELQEAEFCFIGFDSFTSKHFQVLQSIAKNTRGLTVALPTPISRANSHIYETDILEKLQAIGKALNQEIEIYSPKTMLKGEAFAIGENLFSRQPKSFKNGNVFIKEADIPKSEAEFVAKSICFEVFNGKRYKDIVVACSDLKIYGQELINQFERHKIPYYIDSSVVASQTYIALFFKKMLSFAYKRFRKSDLLFFLNSVFFEIDEEKIEKVSQFYEGGGEDFYSFNFGELTNLIKLISSDFIEGAKSLINLLDQNKEKIIEQNLNEKTLSFEMQMPSILADLLNAIENTCSFSSFKEFYSAVELGLETKEVSALPSYYDQVFVGDVTTSFFGDVDSLYLVGANVGAIPKYESEASFLSDDEIEKAQLRFKVEPTIKMINRRNRFKLFSHLTQFKNRLIISYSTADQEGKPLGKSGIVNMIEKIFCISKPIKNVSFSKERDVQNLLFNVGRNYEEVQQLLFSKKMKAFDAELKQVVKITENDLRLSRELSVAKEIGLGEQIKPTEIEKFYSCPFKVYCENVLKLAQPIKSELSPAEIGSLVHEIVADYGKKFSYNMPSKEELDAFLIKKIDGFLRERQIADKELFIQRMKKDLLNIIKKIDDENKNTPFVAWLTEEKLDGEILGKSFSGRVDRVDKCENVFRIIDYKTGKITSNLLVDAKFGKKLQLLAYAKLIQDKTGLICGGVYYFDAKSGFKSSQKQSLQGVTSQSAEKIGCISSKAITDDQMQELINESARLLFEGAQSLNQGKIAPRPDTTSCEYCPHSAICLYDAFRGTRRGAK